MYVTASTGAADLWDRVFGSQSDPDQWVVFATAALALAAVVPHNIWRLSRNAITIAHEGGHGVVALVSGRRLDGIRLHSDTSGLTVSRGKPSGLGMILTAAAGYTAPRSSVSAAPHCSPRDTSRPSCGWPRPCSWRCS